MHTPTKNRRSEQCSVFVRCIMREKIRIARQDVSSLRRRRERAKLTAYFTTQSLTREHKTIFLRRRCGREEAAAFETTNTSISIRGKRSPILSEAVLRPWGADGML